MTMITPSSELTLTKGTSPAGLNEFALVGEGAWGRPLGPDPAPPSRPRRRGPWRGGPGPPRGPQVPPRGPLPGAPGRPCRRPGL